MTTSAEQQQFSAIRALRHLRYFLKGRRGLVVMSILLIALGTYVGWTWLVTAGIGPILIAIAPCAAMCALGLCMNRMGHNSCSDQSTKGDRNA